MGGGEERGRGYAGRESYGVRIAGHKARAGGREREGKKMNWQGRQKPAH